MKTVMFVNMVIMTAYAMCVTYAAVRFDNAAILWWYLLLPMLGFSYEGRKHEE